MHGGREASPHRGEMRIPRCVLAARIADALLRRIADEVMASPGDRRTPEDWAKRAGMSERTLARTISLEIGMTLATGDSGLATSSR